MRRLSVPFLCIMGLVVLYGCGQQKPAAIIIDDLRVSRDEFERAFQASPYAKDQEAGKKRFLDLYITSKLILQEAVREGLDRKQDFLQNIQIFWEQTLLKLMVSKKAKELLSNITVSDKAVSEYYQKNKEQFANKDLPAVYNDIKILLLKKTQNDHIQAWTDTLRQKARVSVNDRLILIKP